MDNKQYYQKIEHTSAALFDLAVGNDSSDDRYRELELIGSGAVKQIYRVLDLTSGRIEAMALPQKDLSKEQLQRFLEEARMTASLEHAGILQVYDLGFNREGIPFFTMKLCSESRLSDIHKEEYSYFQLIDIFLKICEAIAYAHSAGAVHRDIKPENILLGNYGEVLVCDWGSAQILPGSILEIEVGILSKPLTKGTPGYMSPEQERDEAPNCSHDIYSLGSLLFNLLTGHAPEHELSPSAIASEKNIPAGIEAICMKAKAENAADRYSSVNEIIKDLKAWLGGFAPKAEEASFKRQFLLLINRHRKLSISIISSLVIVAFLSVLYVSSLRSKEKQTRYEKERAEKALELYEIEKSSREKIGKFGADLFIQRASNMVNVHYTDDAEELLKSIPEAVLDEKQKKKINAVYGRIAFYRQQYKKALVFFRDATGDDSKYLAKKAMVYVKKKNSDSDLLPSEEFVQLIEELSAKSRHHVYGSFRALVLKIPDVKKHIPIVEKMILYNNPAIRDLNIRLTKTDGKYHLSLAGNPQMNDMLPVRQLPLNSIDLSGCPVLVRNLYILNTMPLEEINIKDCKIKNFSFLANLKHLKRIIAGKKEMNNSSFKKFTAELKVIIK